MACKFVTTCEKNPWFQNAEKKKQNKTNEEKRLYDDVVFIPRHINLGPRMSLS